MMYSPLTKHGHTISLATAGVLLFILTVFFAYTTTTEASPNAQINYQGKLTTATNVAVPDGTYNMRFWLLTSPTIATTSAVWTESLTGTNRVQVTNGLFSVMLGSTTPFTGVDFNQTLYLGVEIGSTTVTAQWDGEMSPRKVLGTVPAAFEADKLDGLNSTQFVRTDATSTIAVNTADTLLTITQNGTGDILNLFDGTTEVLSVLDGGNIGIGSTSPSRKLTIAGDMLVQNFIATGTATTTNLALSGKFFDVNSSPGTNGMVLQTTGSGVQWVATSTLGFAGVTDFLALSDVSLGSYTANRILFTSASEVVDSANFTFDGANFRVAGNSEVTGTATSTNLVASSTLRLVGGTSFPTNPSEGTMFFSSASTSLYVYEGGKWQADRTTATFIVAASDTQNKEKADYVASGTNDQDTIEQALAALPSHGGLVYLLPGTYNINNEINITQASTTLMGSGPSTLLKITATSTSWDVIDVANASYVTIKDLAIDGSRASAGNQDGISLSSVSSSTISGVRSNRMRSDGLSMTGAEKYNIYVVGGTFESNAGNGLYADAVTNLTITESVFSNNTGYSIQLSAVKQSIVASNDLRGSGSYNLVLVSASDYNTISGNRITNATSIGILLSGVSYNNVSNNIIRDGGSGGILMQSSADYNTIANNTITGNATYGVYVASSNNSVVGNKMHNNTGSSANSSIVLASAVSSLIADNTITDTAGSGYAIDVDAGSSGNTLVGNTYSGVGAASIRDLATNTKYTQSDRITLGTANTQTHAIFKLNASSSSSTAEIIQQGTGSILDLYNSTSRVLTVTNAGRLGLGTTSPSRLLSVAGDMVLTGALYGSNNSAGTNGMVLQTTGSGVQWVATSSLGFAGADGASHWLYNGSRLSPSTTVGIGIFASSTIGDGTATGGLTINGGATTTGTSTFLGKLIVGTPTNITTDVGDLLIGGTLKAKARSGSDNTFFDFYNSGGTKVGTVEENSAGGAGGLAFAGWRNGSNGRGISFSGIVQNDDGSEYSAVDFNGSKGTDASTPVTYISNTPIATFRNNGSSPVLTIGPRGTLTVDLSTIGNATGTVVRANASQITNLSEWRSADSLVLTAVTKNGFLGIGTSSPSASFAITGTSTTNLLSIASSTGSNLLTMLSDGKLGLGTTTPAALLSVAGNMHLTGALYDRTYNAGTSGMVLQTTGSGVQWVATSTLGLGATQLFTDGGTYLYPTVPTESLLLGGTSFANMPGLLALNATSTTGTLLFASSSPSFTGNLLDYRGGLFGGSLFSVDYTGRASSADGFVSNYSAQSLARSAIEIGHTLNAPTANHATDTASINFAILSPAPGITVSHDILSVSDSSSYSYVGTNSYTVTSNLLDLDRSIFAGTSDTVNLSGAVAAISDACSGATCVSSANALQVNQTYTGNTGSALNITTASTNGGLAFRVNDDGTFTDSTPFVVDSFGRVGVGTTSPSSLFSLTGISTTTNLFAFASSTGSNLLALEAGGRLRFGTTTSADIFINGGATSTNPQGNGNNVALGNQALSYYVPGSATYNIALGTQALYGSSSVLMTGDYNVAIGYQALMSNTSGVHNVGIGTNALSANQTGSYNVGFGSGALMGNVGGAFNSAFGVQAMYSNTNGADNTAFGTNAMYSNTTGSYNVAVGSGALYLNGASWSNVAVGKNALFTTITGASSTALGTFAGFTNITGSNNLYLGDEADSISAALSNAIAIGSHAKVGASHAMVLGGSGIWNTNIVTGTSTPWAKFSIQNNYGSTTALFDIATTTSASYATSSIFRVNHDGKVGIGTTSPYANLTVSGTLGLTGALYDRTASAGTNGMVLQTTGTGVQWVATSTLGLGGGGSSNWVDNGSYLSTLTGGDGIIVAGSSTIGGGTGATGLTILGNATTTGDIILSGVLYSKPNTGGCGTCNSIDLTATVSSANNDISVSARGQTGFYTNSSLIASIGSPDGISGIGIGDSAFDARFEISLDGSTSNKAFMVSSNDNTDGDLLTVDGTGRLGIGTTTPWAKLAVMNTFGALIPLFDIATTTSSGYATTSLFNVQADGRVGIGTSTPLLNHQLVVSGVTAGKNLQAMFQTPEGSYGYIDFASGAMSNGGSADYRLLLNNGGSGNLDFQGGQSGLTNILSLNAANMYVYTGTGSRFGVSTSTPAATLAVAGAGTTNPLLIASSTGETLFRVDYDGRVSIGSSTPESSTLTIQKTGITGTTTAGIKQYLGFATANQGALSFGNNMYIVNAPTATSTLVGNIVRIVDDTSLGNTVRGFEVQAHRGSNTKGENTGLSAFGRTFGLRGTTEGDAGDTFAPAGVFAESRGVTQGNALRAYSGTITTANLVSLFQDTSAFSGTGLLMNFGNSGGSFAATSSAKFLDMQVGGSSRFTVTAAGTTTIGDGTTNYMAGLQIGYGGLCVDNDGSCAATTSGRITSVSSATGNSDLAEMYFARESLMAGEIVMADGGLSIARADTESKSRILGVVSTKPGLLLGFDDTSLTPGETAYPVALKGRVPIRLSTENGPIAKGDRITLSSVPGVGMKATESDVSVGIALEDFDGESAYTAGFLNQFGDDLVKAKLTPRYQDTDTRAQDGCYYGAGSEEGEEECDPKKVKSVRPVTISVDERTVALRELEREDAASTTLADGTEVRIGQALLFVQLENHIVRSELDILAALNATSSLANGNGEETMFDRLKELANAFVDGVLRIAGIKADEVQTDKLCVGETCVDEATLRELLNAQGQSPVAPSQDMGSTPEPEPAPEVEEDTTTGSEVDDSAFGAPEGGVEGTTPPESTEVIEEEVSSEGSEVGVTQEIPEPEVAPEPEPAPAPAPEQEPESAPAPSV